MTQALAPQSVDEAFGYDAAYVAQVGTLPQVSKWLRPYKDSQLLQIALLLFSILLALQLIVHWVSGNFANIPAGSTITGWLQFFQFDLLHAFLISYMAIGAEGFRRGYACHLRRLTPWLHNDAPTPEDIIAKRSGMNTIIGLVILIVFVPLMSIPVYDLFTVKAVFWVMVIRTSILYWLLGSRITEFVMLSIQFAAQIRTHLSYRLVEDDPRKIIGAQIMKSSLFLMLGVAVTIPTLTDTETITQTIVVLGLITLVSLFILFLPIFALRDKIRDTKAAELALLQPRLNACWDALQRGEDPPHDLPALVAWRQEIRNTSDWVFDGESALRLLIILMVPAGSLLASELAESLLDRIIGG